MPYYREPPIVRYLDHFFIFIIYILLAIAGWVIYGQATEGLRPEYLKFALGISLFASIGAISALIDRFRFEFAALPFLIGGLTTYALTLLAEPVEFHGALIMVAFAFVKADRFLHLWVVSSKLRKAKEIENGS